MLVVGIPSYNRPKPLEITLRSLMHSRHVMGVVAVADASSHGLLDSYRSMLSMIRKEIGNLVYETRLGRKGSVNARNATLELALQYFPEAIAFITLEDDCVVPSENWLDPVIKWLRNPEIGIVGGTRINLTRRRKDPEFYLNITPYLAEALTRLTGFIFLDSKHGPRYTNYTTHLMAIRMKLIKEGLRYDPNYGGTGYREESDVQEQVKRIGYKIVHEPSFYVYHLGLEVGGDRSVDTSRRFYWKIRNNTYFIKKHRLGVYKLVVSTTIITIYAMLYGLKTFKVAMKAFRDSLEAHPYLLISDENVINIRTHSQNG